MILHFEGGPADGLEEQSETTPILLRRMPSIGEMMRSAESAEEGAEPPEFGATYELAQIDYATNVALYLLFEQ